jgi:hypothetical protein
MNRPDGFFLFTPGATTGALFVIGAAFRRQTEAVN